MVLTRDFKETVRERVQRDPAFRDALLAEGIECLLTGDVDTGKAVLRDYINATIGFQELGGLTDKSPKSLMRMFSPDGNPQAGNLFGIVGELQKCEGLQLKVQTTRQEGETPLTFAPWIGDQYGRKSRFGCKLLVVGQSHYETDRDREPSLELTQRVVKRRVDGQNRQPFFTVMTKVLTQNLTNNDFSVWHEVAFYNYIQSFVAPRSSPTERQWQAARGPFRTVLKDLGPDAVLVASRAVGSRIDQHNGIGFAVVAHPAAGQKNVERIRVFRELMNRVRQAGG